MQTGAATVESSMELPQKIKNGTALWPSDSTSRNLSEETRNTNLKEHKHPCVHWALFTIAKIWKQPKCPSRWLHIKAMIKLHNGILLGHKKEKSFTLCDSMDGPGEHYAKWKKPVRERQIPYDLTLHGI